MSADSKKPPRSPDAFEISKKYSRVLFSMWNRPPMNKVRKSLALDVKEVIPKSKRKCSKAEARRTIKEEPVTVCFNSSSFYSQRPENILDQGFLMGPSDTSIFPSAVPPAPMSKEWMKVVCGQTKDQLTMTEKARRYLSSLKSHTPSRALILS